MAQQRIERVTASAGNVAPQGHRHWPRIRQILEQKIVPSLVIKTQSVFMPSESWAQEEEASDALVALALQGREDQARDEMLQLATDGMSFERLQLGLLAPAAQKIGTLWEEDSLSFVDVTLAVGTLQRLMHFVSLDLTSEPMFGLSPKSILIFPEPDAKHVMGASMAARFFTHAGWQVDFMPRPKEADLCKILAGRHIDAVGISVNRTETVAESARVIARLRKASRNPDVVFIGGGSALSRAPELMEKLRVDAVFAAIEFAPKQATNLIREHKP